MLAQMVDEKDNALNELTGEFNRLREELERVGGELMVANSDLRRLTELYNAKDKETEQARMAMEEAKEEYAEKARRLED